MLVYYYVFHLECIKYFDCRTDPEGIDLRLLETCCQIYEEARYEIFKWNKFHFVHFRYINPFHDKPLLPAQKSAIRSISVSFGFMGSLGWFEIPDLCTSVCKFISGFKGLRDAHIRVAHCELPSVIFQDGENDWIRGITILQTLGFVRWAGELFPTAYGTSFTGYFHLRMGTNKGFEATWKGTESLMTSSEVGELETDVMSEYCGRLSG